MPNYKDQRTPEEKRISEELDGLYPKAKSRSVVEHGGRKYQIKYFPIAKSDDGQKVKEWGHRWIPLK